MREQDVGVIAINHEVTAAEAAYVTLVCHCNKYNKQGEWLNNAIPLIYEQWAVNLRALYSEIFRAGVPVHGVPIGLFAEYAPVGALNLSNTRQGYLGRANWFGSLRINHGFGLILRQGSVATGDIVVVGGIYEPI
jgi:hypothetical protein